MVISTIDGTQVGEIAYDGGDQDHQRKWYKSRYFQMVLYRPDGKKVMKIDRRRRRVYGDALVYLLDGSNFNEAGRLIGEIQIPTVKLCPRYNMYDCTQAWNGSNFEPFASVQAHCHKLPVNDNNDQTICSIQSLYRKYVHSFILLT